MKRIMFFVYALAACVVLLSCSVPEELEFEEVSDNGNPAAPVSVEVEFNAPGLATKSSEYEHSAYRNVEDFITHFHYYVYDSKGFLVESGNCSSGSKVTIDMSIALGSKYTMYAIANGKEISPVPASEDGIRNLLYTNGSSGGLNSEVEGSPRLIMTASAPFESTDTGYKVKLDFRRMTARIGLSFDVSKLNPDVSLEILEASIVNIPSQVYYFKTNTPDETMKCQSSAYSLAPAGPDDRMVFYCYENVQGNLLPNNDSQMHKFFPLSSKYNDLCTYICVKGRYSSPRKRGEIIYRLYPGKNASDFSVERNSVYDVILKFSAEGGVDEVSWRVVTDGLETLATGISLEIDKTELGENEMVPFKAILHPDDVSSKHLLWNISEPGIAGFSTADGKTMLSLAQLNEMDDNRGPFKIYGLANGSALLSAQTTDGTLKSASARISVNLAPYPYEIAFAESSVPLWYLNNDEFEMRSIAFSKMNAPQGQVPDVKILSGEDCIEIVSVNRNEVVVKSKGTGRAVIGAAMGMSIAECSLTVSKLGIQLDTDNLDLKAGYAQDVKYSISPDHASAMGVNLYYCDGRSSTYSATSERLSTQLSNSKLNVRADYLNNYDLSENHGRIKVQIKGHSAYDECSYTIELPMKVLQNEQLCLMNYYNGTQYTAKLFDCPTQASLSMSWFRDYSSSGTDGSASSSVSAPASSELFWNREECRFSYPSPGTSLNGHYRANVILDGDFSKVRYIKANGALGTENDFISECASADIDFKFAEMVYIISYVKSDSRNSVSKNRYIYVDELIIRCVKHYRSNIDSSLFSDLSFDYTYDGKKFHYSGAGDSHTEYYVDYDITFTKDREYPYIEYNSSDGRYYNSSFIYSGSNAPARHFDGTKLSVPAMNNIGNHKGFWYKYMQKNSGLSGFCKDIDWQILYKNLF